MNQTIRKRIEDINNGIVPEGYKQTPFGIFPCDWETEKKLDDLGTFDKGKGLPGDKMTDEGVPCIGYGDIYMKYNYHFEKAQTFVDEKTASESQPIEKGTLLFTGTGETAEEIGKCVCYNGDETIYAGGDIILFNSKEVNPMFLAYQQYQDFSLKRKAMYGQGHSVVHIQRGELAKLPTACPQDKTEQSKIAEILMKWDEMVELQEQYIQKLELRKKAIMKKLLTPKDGWKKCRLNELVYKEKGKAVKIDNEGSFPIIDMEYLDKGVFTNYTNEKGILTNEQDILLLWDGASAGTLLTGVKGVVGSTFALLTLKNDKTCSKYLYYWLTIENLKNVSLREGSGIPHMPKDYLQKQVVKYPILDKQIKISKTLALLEEEISLQKEKLAKIKEQRKAMQQYLLTGIVRVS